MRYTSDLRANAVYGQKLNFRSNTALECVWKLQEKNRGIESMKEHIEKKKDRKEVIKENSTDAVKKSAREDKANTVKKDTKESKLESAKEVQKEEKTIHWFHINRKYMSICRYALFVIIAAILIYIIISHWGETRKSFSNLFNVLSPFIIGVLMAYFLIPLVAKIQGLLRKFITKGKYEKVTKSVSIFLAYLLVIGFIAIAFVFVIPQMGQSIRELTDKIPFMYRTIMREMADLQKRYPNIDLEYAYDQLEEVMPNLINYGTDLMGSLLPMVYSLSVSIVKMAINLLLGIMISIYMIYSKENFRFQAKRVVYAILPEEKGDELCTTLRECNNIFGAFLISKAIDSLIIGCICCVAMNIIGLPYAVLLSVIVGITNMIPYFGPFIGAVPGVLIYLCTDWELAVIFAIMILVLQQFDGLILGPRLLGQSTGLSPIWVIFAITVGGAYFGVIGMFIGVPVVAVIAYLINKLISSRLRGKKITALQEFKEG